MRLFKKIRGKGLFSSVFGGGGWHAKDCTVDDSVGEVKWSNMVEGAHAKHKDEDSMRGLSLKGAIVSEPKEEPLPVEVAKFLKSNDFKYYVVRIASPDIKGEPLEFGYVDHGMMKGFYDNVRMAAEKASGV